MKFETRPDAESRGIYSLKWKAAIVQQRGIGTEREKKKKEREKGTTSP